MPYDGGLTQVDLENRSESVASTIINALNHASGFMEKMSSWSNGRSNAELAAWVIATDKSLDTQRFPNAAAVEAFIADIRSLAIAVNAISIGVSAGDRADIVKFA